MQMVNNDKNKMIRLVPEDNVAVAAANIPANTAVEVAKNQYTTREAIPFGHKMMLKKVETGDAILRYGHRIGYATRRIEPGEWVHDHNIKTSLEGFDTYVYQQKPEAADQNFRQDTFAGYVRKNQEVGTRNEVWVIPTVSCVNHTVEEIARQAQITYSGLCDGFLALPHNAGCSQLGDDHLRTQKILANIVRHPNAGGVLLVSLGCENNTVESFMSVVGEVDQNRVKVMTVQEVEGDEVAYGTRLAGEIAKEISSDCREQVSASRLKIGMKCGGSDAFSGITANPLCGHIADKLIAQGGAVVLTEVPEMFGAETILMNRADSAKTFQSIVDLINHFKEYYLSYSQPIYENPSPGNRAGGITTLEEKSLGCIQKGGSSAVVATLDYGDVCAERGLNLLNGPGNDNVSITNLLASGVQMILFTTGRGNPLGTAVPTVKIASNGQLFQRKNNWMDFNAGILLEDDDFSSVSEQLWETVLRISSGIQKAKNEENGHRSIMIFKDGVML